MLISHLFFICYIVTNLLTMTDLELYNQAKEAYYNGTPIMTDYEFDELEERLGLANKSYVGAKRNPTYTQRHPFIMGSLSKVQIHEKDGVVNWPEYMDQVKDYIYRTRKGNVIITPKFDGCSFELQCCTRSDGSLYINSISSRGDGEFGKDLKKHLADKFKDIVLPTKGEYVLRGEVLIDKSVFAEKYSDFVNPRSFVSGILNRDYDEHDDEFLQMVSDLSVVIYDARTYHNVHGLDRWVDIDWPCLEIQHLPEFYKIMSDFDSADDLKKVYGEFDQYRQTCPFALDGIVIKPTDDYRINNTEDARPKDCIAIKFIPMLQQTEVIAIEWNTGKTNELHPVIIVNPVTMDGKQVSRASAHNYGYMLDSKISIGTKVILSLAGDIIPFIYKITDTTGYDENQMNLPKYDTYVEGCHLYKKLSEAEYTEMKFIQSAGALGIPQIGPAAAKKIFDYTAENSAADDFLGIEAKPLVNNILCVSEADICNALGGKSGASAAKSFSAYKKELSLVDIIISCTFESCGKSIANAISDKLLFGHENFEHLAEKGWRWCYDENSTEMLQLNSVLENCGKTLDIFKQEAQYINEKRADQIPVILTGEPTTCSTKDEFIRLHPEYRVTTSWKEVKIVFTNSVDSNTGKMKKAREKGIEIRQY